MNAPIFTRSKHIIARLFATGLAVLPVLASAHPGHYHPGEEDEFAAQSLIDGLAHPITGIDHLLAALAVGWVCAAMGSRKAVFGSGVFLGALLAGAAAGISGFVLPGLEAALGISVLALGMMLASGRSFSTPWLIAALGLVGAVHGSAHGSEGPAGSPMLVFGAGYVLTTVVLCAVGAGLFSLSKRWSPARQVAGTLTALVGAFFLVQAAS